MEFTENQFIELKESIDEKAIIKSIVAFANSQGGSIYIGIKDDGTIVGVTIGNNTLENLANYIESNTDPKLFPLILTHKKNKKDVIEVKVEESLWKPHFAKHIPYKRVGKTVKVIDAREVENLIGNRTQRSYDSLPLLEADANVFDLSKVKFIIEKMNKEYDVYSYLRTRRCLLKKEETNEYPSIGGILLFGHNPQDNLLQSYITLVDYTLGENRKRILNIEGNLFTQINEILEEIYRIHPPIQHLPPNQVERKELNVIPYKVLREAIVNAICHRKYDDVGRKIIIKIYRDKISISNPANFDLDFKLEKIQEYQFSRNPIIARVLYEAGYMEEIGEGVDKILEWNDNLGYKQEETYSFNNNQLTLELYLASPDFLIALQYPLNNRQKEILTYLHNGKSYSSGELAKSLNVSVDTILGDVNYLSKITSITKEGTARSTRYKLGK